MDPAKLTRADELKALSSLIFFIEKRDSMLKARPCADRSKQRRDKSYNKHGYASPTCANNSIMIASAIETKEGRDVDIIYIPGAYLNTYIDKHGNEKIIMLFKGKLAELIIMVDPKLYRKYITYDSKGITMLYVQMNKTLHGLLQSVLLLYKKFRKDLEICGFEINPYDPCVVNTVINGHQMTVTWHVDDLKVSHKDPFEITKFATY